MDFDLNDWKMILATCALIFCMVWDIAVERAKDYVKVCSWIPSNLFVLNALTILILGNVDIEKVNVFGGANEKDLEVLVDNQLRMDVARLTMCVFLGCILPGIAMAGTEGRWSNVAALFVSLSFHIATEIYALQNGNNSKVERGAGPWFVSSGVLLLFGASSLLLLVGTVIFTGKLRPHFLANYAISENLSEDVENEGNRWETLRIKVMKSWVAARAWKVVYFSFNSALSPGEGIIVTICVVVTAGKMSCRSSLLHYNNGVGNLTFYLQCIFILVGWMLMLYRWFKAALYFANSFQSNVAREVVVFCLMPGVIVVKRLCPRLIPFLVNPEITLMNILISVSCLVPLLASCVLILAFSLLLLFCFICWYFSNLVSGSKFVQKLCKVDNEAVSENKKCSKYQSILEDIGFRKKEIHIFWMINKKTFDRIRGSMDEEGNKIEQSCTGLFSIMGNHRLPQNQCLRPIEKSWMRTISIIFSDIANVEIGVDMKDAFEAYRETQDVLMFVDCPGNTVGNPLNMVEPFDFEGFIHRTSDEIKICSVEKKLKQGLGTSLEEKRELTPQERARADNLLRGFNNLDETVSNSLLIRLGECFYNNREELGEMLRTLVGHVIVSALLEAPDVILKYTKQWAQNIDEAKIERAIEVAGKVSALLEKLVEDVDDIYL